VVQFQQQGLKGLGLIAVREKHDGYINPFCSTPCTTY